MVSTDEINLHRLLISCEKKIKQENVDLWTGSEKIKFATYVKYLQTLIARSGLAQSRRYNERINSLAEAVSLHTMQVDVEKGIAEARATKKVLLDSLQSQEAPEPDWLLNLKEEMAREKEQDEKAARLEDEAEEEEMMEDMLSEKVPTPQVPIEKPDIRQRHGPNITREEETSNIEHVLQHHRQMHDELTTDLGRMAKQLKMNTVRFGDTLAKDDMVLRDAQEAVETNLERMQREGKRLEIHNSKSWGTSFMTMGIVLFVCIAFILVFLTIKLLPKAK
ncbi:vesicle transport protein [Phycomyces blakesleeanus]